MTLIQTPRQGGKRAARKHPPQVGFAKSSGKKAPHLIIDGGRRIPLSWREYALLKLLVKKMETDAPNALLRNVDKGWAGEEEWTLPVTPPELMNDPFATAALQPGEAPKIVHHLRAKLAKHGIPGEFIETGTRGTGTYRINTNALNRRMERK